MADNNGETHVAQKKNKINFFSKLVMLFTVSMTMVFQHMVGLQNREVKQIVLGVSMCIVTGMVAWGLSLKYNENIQMAEKRFLLYSGISTVLCSIYFLSKNRREYSHLKEREGRSPVSRWEMNRLRTRDSLLTISIVRLFECYL